MQICCWCVCVCVFVCVVVCILQFFFAFISSVIWGKYFLKWKSWSDINVFNWLYQVQHKVSYYYILVRYSIKVALVSVLLNLIFSKEMWVVCWCRIFLKPQSFITGIAFSYIMFIFIRFEEKFRWLCITWDILCNFFQQTYWGHKPSHSYSFLCINPLIAHFFVGKRKFFAQSFDGTTSHHIVIWGLLKCEIWYYGNCEKYFAICVKWFTKKNIK